jgi:hypothetical protein
MRRSTMARLLAAAALMLVTGGVVLDAPAHAIPDGGAGANTAGTSASASPRTLTAGATIHFTVSGFPAGEVVYLKIDDGTFCSDKAVHGACVVHQQRLTSRGSAAGSFVLPSDLKPGRHWLRFLASKEMTDAAGNYLGVKGYTTRRGADFTITAGSAGGATTSGGSSGSSGTTTGGTSGSATGTTALAAGETLVVAAPKPTASASGGATASAAPDGGEEGAAAMSADEKASIEAAVEAAMAENDDATSGQRAADVRVHEAGFPWLGSAGLALMLAAAVAWMLRVRAVRTARSSA